MTTNDENQDRELLQRYARASEADPREPSAAVRAAILEEARRVAASLSAPVVTLEPKGRLTSRWKMTAWGTAAAALLAALIIAPRFWNPAPPPVAAASAAKSPFNQAANNSSTETEAEPRPVVPVVPVPAPQAQVSIPRLVNDVPTLHHPVAAPPPVHIPEQSVDVTSVGQPSQNPAPEVEQQLRQSQPSQLASLGRSRALAPSESARALQAGAHAKSSLSAAVAAGDVAETTALLDQGAAVNGLDAAGRTPLMLAIGQNQIDTVRLLLSRGADPNAPDKQGMTPLQLARRSHLDEIASVLIQAGAR